jgi:hypothetical protein
VDNTFHGFDNACVTPQQLDKSLNGVKAASSSPFPSLEDVWFTASTHATRQTKSPLETKSPSKLPDSTHPQGQGRAFVSSQASQPSTVNEFENRMLWSQAGDSPTHNFFADAAMSTTRDATISPPPTKPNRAKVDAALPKPAQIKERQTSPFIVPAGSQVVELSSDNNSSPLSEKYADDDIDETYSEANSLPSGPGWVQKNRLNPRRSSRGVSLPLPEKVVRGRGLLKAKVPVFGAVEEDASEATGHRPRMSRSVKI